MLPILSEIEFSEIVPIAESATHRFVLEAGINAMIAENGRGKTTLCDVIERALCSDAHAQRYSAFAKKRKTKSAFIKSTWIADKEITLHQALTDAGIRTKIREKGKSEKSLSKQEYSNYLARTFHLSLPEFQNLFQSLYYKREDDHALLGRTEETEVHLMSFFKLLNKYTAGSPDDIKLRNKILEKNREKKVIQDEIKKLEDDENRIRSIMDAIGISEVSEAILDAKHEDIKKRIKQKQEELEELEEKKNELEHEAEAISEKLQQIRDKNYEIMREVDKARAKKSNLEKEKFKIEKEIEAASKVGNEKYESLKSKVNNNPRCEFCGTNIAETWNQRLQAGCPLCGTEWARLPRELREGILKEPEVPETEGLEKEIEIINIKITEAKQEITEKELKFKEAKEQEKIIQQKVAEIKAKIKMRERDIKSKTSEMHSLSKQETAILTQKEFLTSKVNLQAILSKKLKLQEILEKLEEELAELKEQENVSNERSQILENFRSTTMQIFGYSIVINPRDKAITLMADHSTRAYESLSGGEKYFIDICLRISVWKYLLENGFTRQGMLIIDSPESSLDERRLEMLANVLNEQNHKFLFIVTTRNQAFYEKLKAKELILRKKMVQTSLFDFIQP
ncbi:MAG: hypothetical protein ACTSQE_04880 [Candidatus Heimdallarchaeaceae archaeon]